MAFVTFAVTPFYLWPLERFGEYYTHELLLAMIIIFIAAMYLSPLGATVVIAGVQIAVGNRRSSR
ncbi:MULTISPECIES: hypothetical protein [unclassified Streptomyces]|uniref:hypothetical protein n=1 Tax=unclassified Streptomyces TaxID=2593676 RepID=UPI0011811083|nr:MULTISPECIES: hypothetical protein [unclassified Streptomyces]